MDSKEDNNIKIKKVDDNYFKEYYLKHKVKFSEKIHGFRIQFLGQLVSDTHRLKIL